MSVERKFAKQLTLQKGRVLSRERFVGLPFHMVTSPEFADLSGRAVKLLLAMLAQYHGSNNGALAASPGMMNPFGFTSKDQLAKALDELLAGGWIIRTRQGGRHAASLFAVTFREVDECGGKLDIKPPRGKLDLWKHERAADRPQFSFPATRGTLPRRTGNSFPATRGTPAEASPQGGAVVSSFEVVASPHGGENYYICHTPRARDTLDHASGDWQVVSSFEGIDWTDAPVLTGEEAIAKLDPMLDSGAAWELHMPDGRIVHEEALA